MPSWARACITRKPALTHVQVLAIGRLDEVAEDRIVEDRPPVAVVLGFAAHAHISGVDPALGNGGGMSVRSSARP